LPFISFRVKSGALEFTMESLSIGDIVPPEVFPGELGPHRNEQKQTDDQE
jgi:hypothetical protein